MYDCIIVGSGFCGSIIARMLAEKQNKKILIIEKRNHISGNMYDEIDTNGVRIQKFGPHLFHTNNAEVYQYVSQFTEWIPFHLSCRAEIDGILTPSPFNFSTIDSFYSPTEAVELRDRLKNAYPNRDTVTIVELLESTDQIIARFAHFLFEKDYRPYTSKQWGIPPEKISPSVLKRVPIVLSYQDRFFRDIYEVMPKEGFTKLFDRMLSHPNIDIKLNTDACDVLQFDTKHNKIYHNGYAIFCPVVFTGEIDSLLNYKYGRLPYRALYFEYQRLNISSYQDYALTVYPQAKEYTRITEYTKMPVQDILGKTTIAIEYPVPYDPKAARGNEPYYPIINDENCAVYNLYAKELSQIKNLYICGRLGDYKYYNMDNAIERAFEVYKLLK